MPKVPVDNDGSERDMLAQIEVVKDLHPGRRERIRYLATVFDGRPDLIPYLARQFGLQSSQVKIVLESTEDDMDDDPHLRKIVGLGASGKRINPELVRPTP